MFRKYKEEIPQSPIGLLLSAFTEQSVRMHSILGFPGVLLLLAIVFASLPALPGITASPAFTILATASLVGSVATYLAHSYYSLRQAEPQSQMLADYTRLFLEKYLAAQGEVKAQDVTFSIDYILLPLLEKRRLSLSEKTQPHG